MSVQTERYCVACGNLLPEGSKRKTCGQVCRTRLSRRKKLIRKHGALARCNAWWLLWEAQAGPHTDVAKFELIRSGEYIETLVKAYHAGDYLYPPIADYNTALGYTPDGVRYTPDGVPVAKR